MEKNSFNKKKPIIFIPARKGSKGLPFKNRLLLQYTLQAIPDEFKENIIVSTDDEKIINICEKHEIKFDKRDTIFAEDDTSMKDVLLNFKKLHPKLKEAQEIIMLYLTYPQRKWEDVIKAYNFFTVNKTKSLLCKKNINTHPYLMLVDNKNNTGRQLVKHDLYRRQEYPNVFELSHYIAIMIVGEIKNLNKNLYNKDTQFFQIEDKIDVDTIDDLKKFNPDLGKKRVLILGNDKTLNDLKNVKFKDDVVIVGINRAHEIIKTNYTFFSDFVIFNEIYKKENGDLKKIKEYNLVASNWINRHGKNVTKKWEQQNLIKIHNRQNEQAFPDSVTFGIEYFNNLFKGNVTFFVYGVSLQYDKIENHFWTNKISNNRDPVQLTKAWCEPRYKKTYENFNKLKKENINIISVSKNSKINKLFKYQDINDLIKFKNNVKEPTHSSVPIIKPKLSENKIAFFTSLSDKFFIGFETFMKSLLKHNKWFNNDFIILDIGLSDTAKEKILNLYSNVIFETPKFNNYKYVNTKSPTYLYKFEAFSYIKYDRIITIDTDMLVIGNISKLLTIPCNFGAVQAYDAKTDTLNKEKYFDTGLTIIDKQYLNKSTYENLLELTILDRKMSEQNILNNYFKNKVTLLPKKYNYEKVLHFSINFKIPLNKVKILHYVSYKPWEKNKPTQELKFKEIENLWWAIHNEK